MSKGEEILNPGFFSKEEKKLSRAQKKLSRKEKDSSNWQKQVARLQKLHAKVANQREDLLHKTSFRLANTYSVICVENLNICNQAKIGKCPNRFMMQDGEYSASFWRINVSSMAASWLK